MNSPDQQLTELQSIIEKLRGENGCPWDKKQTTDSLRTYLIEEAHELHDALNSNDTEEMKEELGDMLFILTFLAHMFEERNMFTLGDAIKTINDKMIRRHPHVFDSSIDLTEEEQRQTWLDIKKTEKKVSQISGQTIFSSVPKSLPALRRAQRISEKAAHANLPASDSEHSIISLRSALEGLLQKIPSANTAPDIDSNEAGNLLYLLADLCRQRRVNPEEALFETTNNRINHFLEAE